jgi:hypothetical protein
LFAIWPTASVMRRHTAAPLKSSCAASSSARCFQVGRAPDVDLGFALQLSSRSGRDALDSARSSGNKLPAVFVKGFRMPAGRRREGMHGGRRPKSLEGGKRGVFWVGGSVSLWGFDARLRDRFEALGEGRRPSEWLEGGLGRPGCRGTGSVLLRELCFLLEGSADGYRRPSVSVTGEISAPDRRSGRGREGGDTSVLVMSCRGRLTVGATGGAGSRVRRSR